MDFAKALAAYELWGWPVDKLDRLLELRQQAGRGEISIEAWREQDATLRAGLPAVDRNEVRQFQHEWLVNGPRDASDEARGRLTGRLTALAEPAPSDAELWHELSEIDEALADPKHSHRLVEMFREEQVRISMWLTRPGSGIDPVTGLPWSRIAEYRVITDPDIGPVPQYVDSARQVAMSNATAAERQRAEMVAQDRDRKLAAATANLSQNRVTWLPRLLHDAAADDEGVLPLVGDLTRIWSDPKVQQLLVEETSREWPAPYDLSPGYRVDEM